MGVISKLIPLLAKRKAKTIAEILNNPIELTEAKLKSILECHSYTVFGKDHNFAKIKTPEQFSETVPLYDYSSMKPYWDKLHASPESPIVTVDPTIWYVQSSGSTGKPKALPISKAGLADYTTASMLFLMSFVNAKCGNNRVFDGTMITFAAPARLGELNGVPLGYMTGISREMVANALLRRLIKPDEEIFNMTDIGQKLWAYAKYAVQENVTSLAGITTLTISFIRKMQNEYGPSLLEEFEGTKHEKRIRESLNDDGTMNLETLWPNLILIGATGIDADPYKRWLKETLPNATLWDNYAGSEGIYGTTLLKHTDNGIQLLPHINFFEFIPENEIHKDDPRVVPLSEVQKNHRYEIVLTNMMGYTRYRIGDMLTFKDTDPFSVHRIGRKGRVVNLAGEKLTDAHVNEGISAACKKTGAQLLDYTVVGTINGSRAHYTISAMFQNNIDLSEFASAFDDAVGESNGEFKHSLEFGALGPTAAVNMETSHTENIIANTHIQAKSRPLASEVVKTEVMA
ncbi:MAG: GH3 auxin-responsive promoter family protein [Candidatus Thorarchaeota archaeon]